MKLYLFCAEQPLSASPRDCLHISGYFFLIKWLNSFDANLLTAPVDLKLHFLKKEVYLQMEMRSSTEGKSQKTLTYWNEHVLRKWLKNKIEMKCLLFSKYRVIIMKNAPKYIYLLDSCLPPHRICSRLTKFLTTDKRGLGQSAEKDPDCSVLHPSLAMVYWLL